ncbi:acyl-CoA desaturase [Tateyamaria omphalii]|uniref:acyl-CoA desaturase n=1 Tax=Tateyamaria omphalii TaxID=299262 RepID=UPI001675DA97|nr:acyl-CoA desaturase [Tateyamaria omphalii]
MDLQKWEALLREWYPQATLQLMYAEKPSNMPDLCDTERVISELGTCNMRGTVRVDVWKTLWVIGHGVLGIMGVLLFPQWDAAMVFLALTTLTVCAGHSVGMHRLLIHRSFETHRMIEYMLVWLGTCVGMAGPIGMIRTHDMRDWHQRQRMCPAHPAHRASLVRDAWWQLCCRYDLVHPPRFVLEQRVDQDRIYAWMERLWWLQNLPLGLLLFALGGWAWVLWGISLRIFVSLVGHWWIGHVAHRRGHQSWVVTGLPVQGFNVPRWSLVTFGENWHGNHHAFPYSARLGVEKGQLDPGFWLISTLQSLGLAWNVKMPGDEPDRPGLIRVENRACTGRACTGMVQPHDKHI